MTKLIANLKELDRRTTLETGLSSGTLMENAGQQVAGHIINRIQNRHAEGVILCGPGNNGGDGFVIARHLLAAGYSNLHVIYTGQHYAGDSKDNLDDLFTRPVTIINACSDLETKSCLQSANFIVDAVFGSGLSRDIKGVEAQLIDTVNERKQAHPHSPFAVFAVDVPSGIDSLTGQRRGCAIEADETVTFAVGKPGLWLYPGKACAGEVTIVDIGIPKTLVNEEPADLNLLTTETLKQWPPKRPADGHKYTFGHTLVIAGSQAMPGAALLCSQSALRSGTGLVTLAAPASVLNNHAIAPEIMHCLPKSDSPHLTPNDSQQILQFIEKTRLNALLIGPGLGRHPHTIAAINTLIDRLLELYKQQLSSCPIIVDADGLFALAEKPRKLSSQFILTPHTGECARLLGCQSSDVNANLVDAAKQASERFGCTVVLKSASTLISIPQASITSIAQKSDGDTEPAGKVWISPWGNSGMATAGSGDVLAGLITGLAGQYHAQEREVSQAPLAGVSLHGMAGDFACEELTPYVMTASDITRNLSKAFKSTRN